MMGTWLMVLGLLAARATAPTDLSTIQREPNLEKRADAAISYADRLAGQLSKSYESGDWAGVQAKLEEIAQAAELCLTSLRDSGKNPRKSPKYFKRAELKARAILKRLEAFSQLASVDDRGPVEAARSRVQQVHETLLHEVLGLK